MQIKEIRKIMPRIERNRIITIGDNVSAVLPYCINKVLWKDFETGKIYEIGKDMQTGKTYAHPPLNADTFQRAINECNEVIMERYNTHTKIFD